MNYRAGNDHQETAVAAFLRCQIGWGDYNEPFRALKIKVDAPDVDLPSFEVGNESYSVKQFIGNLGVCKVEIEFPVSNDPVEIKMNQHLYEMLVTRTNMDRFELRCQVKGEDNKTQVRAYKFVGGAPEKGYSPIELDTESTDVLKGTISLSFEAGHVIQAGETEIASEATDFII